MAVLLVELLTQIFTYACTDGGYTGCSLSLVSKHIRAVSRSARFHSISLTKASAEQIPQFSSNLLAERALSKDTGATPRVRHLCLAAAKRSVRLLEYLGPVISGVDDTRPLEITADDNELLKFTADVMTLLTIVAPDLLTLSLVCRLPLYHAGLPLPDIRRVSFPILQELSIASNCPLFSPLLDDTPSADSVGGQTVFPSLTHLHWTCENFPSRNTLSLQPWIDGAPRLTHFRISNLKQGREVILSQLKAAIAPDNGSTPWFPKLEHIVVQPSSPPPSCGSLSLLWRAYSTHVDSLRLLQSAASCPLTLLLGTEKQNGGFREVAKREWLDRLAGGRGCWEICNSIDAASGTHIPHAAM